MFFSFLIIFLNFSSNFQFFHISMKNNDSMDAGLELKDEIGNSSDSEIEILDDDDKEPGEYESFIVDTSARQEMASNNGFNAESSFNTSNIISHVVQAPVEKNGDRKSKGRRSGQACFNCSSMEHAIRDCPIPHNQRRISQNRNSFIKRREGSGRFHEDDGQNDKEIAPGKISDRLREALGIDGRELPEWIYRMRQLGFIYGYPPGYRKMAVEESSVFEFHEGTSSNRKRKHDAVLTIARDKIIKYPGFNYNDGKFRDQKRENYRIPQFEKFIDEQQTYLLQMDAKEKQKVEKSQNKKRKTDDNGGKNIVLFDEEEEEDSSNVLIVKTRAPSSSGSIEDGEIRETDETINVTIRKKKKKTKSKKSKHEAEASSTAQSSTNNSRSIEFEMEKTNEEEVVRILETSIPLQDEDASDLQQNNGVLKPSLDSFAQGIQPFQHQQPVKSSGFIKKLHDIIRKTKKE